MNRIETEVRAERDKLALEVAKLDRLALRKLRDQWRDEPHEQDDPCEVPEHKFSDDCWDEHGQLVLVPTDLPRLSLTEAAVRLAVLHDHVFGDGRFEPICTEEWYDSLSLRLKVRVTCFRRLMDKLDQAELTILRRCLNHLQKSLGQSTTASQPGSHRGWSEPKEPTIPANFSTAARWLNVKDPRTVTAMADRGEICAARHGRKIILDCDDLLLRNEAALKEARP